jgi:hypothetical protein
LEPCRSKNTKILPRVNTTKILSYYRRTTLLKGLSIVLYKKMDKSKLKVVLSVSLRSEFSKTVKLDELRA